MAKHVPGEISGNTAKEVSPTNPRVTLLIADLSTPSFKYGDRDNSNLSAKEYIAHTFGAQ